MSEKCIPPYTPLLYRKTGVPIFLTFAPKYRLWVLVRTESTIYLLSKNKKNIKTFMLKIFVLFIHVAIKNSVYCMGKFT